MPPYGTSETQLFYEAAQRFVDAALRRDDSLFTPGEPVWTPDTIAELSRRIDALSEQDEMPFLERVAPQFAGASAVVYQLMAEVLYVHLLIATRSINGHTKRSLINTVLAWSPEPVSLPPELDQALDQGVARVGTAFLNQQVFQVRFLLSFVRAWKNLPQEEQTRALDDPWAFKVMLFALPINRAHMQREALLHLVHPDTFEPIVSREHKRRAVRENAAFIDEPTDDIDQQLAQVRQNYARHYGYAPTLQHVQQRETAVLPVSLAPGPPDSSLRACIHLALQLDEPSYTPAAIMEQAARISPGLTHGSEQAGPGTLLENLLLLRLLEPLGEGSYRRWPFLAGAHEPELLRYAVLTMLVREPGQAFRLPVLSVPVDQVPRPVEQFPGGEALLAWYIEAGLAQRSDNSTWHMLPRALEVPDASMPLARVLSTFLAHLQQVRAAQQARSPLVDDTLPLLDPAVLEARIAEIQRELLIDRATILRIYRSLVAGYHVILSGPPGTGKTHLAALLPRVLWRDVEETVLLEMAADPALPPTAPPVERRVQREGYAAEVVTATEDWNTRHVIGGIVPLLVSSGGERSLTYTVRHGCLTRAVLANYSEGDDDTLPCPKSMHRQECVEHDGTRCRGRWLVIDEFTRAPIDAAFGSLLTTLGGQRSPLLVPTEHGYDMPVPLPRDFRIIGTLNSFDRHFLNQMSEAMKRRFTFIDVLPPGREYAEAEQAMAMYRALLRLSAQGVPDISIDQASGAAVWEDVLGVRRTDDDEGQRLDTLPRYRLVVDNPQANQALASFWRLFSAIRIYRQIGTAQAEAVYSTLLIGWSVGMSWREALDTALSDTLADQLQVLVRDEQRMLLAFLEHAAEPEQFTERVRHILALLPGSRQMAHLSRLRLADPAPGDDPIDDTDSSRLTVAHLERLFEVGAPLIIDSSGLFARRLLAFINERGI